MDMVNRLIQIAKGIALSLGETCEAVVHDGDHRIAYIANGHISGREQGQEMEESVTSAHIKTFVTDFSLDLGPAGRAAIETLVGRAAALMGKTLPSEGLFLR